MAGAMVYMVYGVRLSKVIFVSGLCYNTKVFTLVLLFSLALEHSRTFPFYSTYFISCHFLIPRYYLCLPIEPTATYSVLFGNPSPPTTVS
jgi:hypothetical protein